MSPKFFAHAGRAAIVALAAVLVAAPASAQQPTPGALAAARELIEVKGAKTMVEPVVFGIIDNAKSTYLQTNPALAKDLDEVANKMRADYAPRATEQLEDMTRLYASRFTEQELKELVAFYRTPLGRKTLVEEPKILDLSFAHLREWGNKLDDEIRSKMRAEMKKRGHDL